VWLEESVDCVEIHIVTYQRSHDGGYSIDILAVAMIYEAKLIALYDVHIQSDM